MKQDLARQWKVTRTWYVEAERASDAQEMTKNMMPDEVHTVLNAIVVKTDMTKEDTNDEDNN